jgi:hypothetical protein
MGKEVCAQVYTDAPFVKAPLSASAPDARWGHHDHALVRASGLDMSRLLALVADLFTTGRLLRAIAGEVTILATVVALGPIGAVSYIRNKS